MNHLTDLCGVFELLPFVIQQLTRSAAFQCANVLGATAPLQICATSKHTNTLYTISSI